MGGEAEVRFFLASAAKDLRRRLADPAALLIWVGIPLTIGVLMSLIGGGGAPPTAHVLVADEDGTFLSGLVAGAGGSDALGDVLEMEEVGLAEGRRRIEAGDATALLVLPEGFSDAVLREEPAELLLVTNPSQQILPSIAEGAVQMLAEAAFYARRLLGPELRTVAGGPAGGGGGAGAGGRRAAFGDSLVASISVGINHKVETVASTLFPPAITVERAGAGGEGGAAGAGSGGGPDIGLLFLPGLLFMSLLFVAQGLSDDLWAERESGTLRRLLTSPRPTWVFLAGKLAAGAGVAAGITAVGLAVALGMFGIAPARAPLAFVWCTFAGTALLAYFLLLQLAATSRRGGNIVGTVIVFPLIMIGGSFFPFESMPGWMRAVGRWTPNGQAVLRLKEILTGTPEAGTLAVAALAIGIPAVLACVIALRRLPAFAR